MHPALLGIVILGGTLLLTLWLKSQLRYRVGERTLRISVLGITLRRVPLTDIERVSKRKRGFVENWSNVWRPKHRQLILHRHGTLKRPLLITPEHRYVFMKQLQAAQSKLGAHLQGTEDISE